MPNIILNILTSPLSATAGRCCQVALGGLQGSQGFCEGRIFSLSGRCLTPKAGVGGSAAVSRQNEE